MKNKQLRKMFPTRSHIRWGIKSFRDQFGRTSERITAFTRSKRYEYKGKR